jgi:xanthine dehydrogenase accessory factor
MAHFVTLVNEELKKGNDLCLATIAKRSGSAPRSSGASMLVLADGSIKGTIGGGKLEGDVHQEACRCLEENQAKLLHFSLKGKDISDSEMLCGGNVDVFLEPVMAADIAAREIYQAAAALAQKGGQGLLLTHALAGPLKTLKGRKLLLALDREPIGGIDDYPGAASDILPELERHIAERPFGLHELDLPSGQKITCLWEAVLADPTVYLFGAGHVSLQVAKLAKMVGFKLVVMDDRKDFANRERFPQADDIWVNDYQDVLNGKNLGEDAYLVILTRGHMYDKEVLSQAIRKNAKYVGMIGSSRKRKAIYRALLDEGVSQETLDKVYSPIGEPIKAETPEEIAVSIVAELIKVRAGG